MMQQEDELSEFLSYFGMHSDTFRGLFRPLVSWRVDPILQTFEWNMKPLKLEVSGQLTSLRGCVISVNYYGHGKKPILNVCENHLKHQYLSNCS